MIHFIDSSETFLSILLLFFHRFSFRLMFEWINNVINGNLKTEFSHIFSTRNLPSDVDIAQCAIESFSSGVLKFKFL